MKTGREERRIQYPHSSRGVYLSVVLASISGVFAVLLLGTQPLLLLYYVGSTVLVTLAALEAKIRIFSSRSRMESEDESSEYVGNRAEWGKLLLLLVLTAGALLVPIFLAALLDYYVWFSLLVGFVSGLSLSEVCLYIYAKKGSTGNGREIQKSVAGRE